MNRSRQRPASHAREIHAVETEAHAIAGRHFYRSEIDDARRGVHLLLSRMSFVVGPFLFSFTSTAPSVDTGSQLTVELALSWLKRLTDPRQACHAETNGPGYPVNL